MTGKRVSAREGVLVRELQGELVLLNLDSEAYFGLDEMGTRMWAVLTQSPTVGAVFDTLAGEYEVEPRQLEEDLGRFIEGLQEAGLIELRDR